MADGDAAAQLNSGMTFGLMNAFRTGNMVVDVVICMLVPMIVKAMIGSDIPNKIQAWIQSMLKGTSNEFIRSISYETKSGGGYYYGSSDDLDSMERNNLLQKAIRLYLSEKSTYTTNTGDVFLIPGRKVTLEKDRWGDECRFSGSYQQLMSYQVTHLPAEGVWVEIVGEKVHFRQTGSQTEQSTGRDSKVQVKMVTFEIMAKGSDGENVVTDWINRVFDWYRARKAKEQDTSRYFLQAQTSKGDEKEFQYKKYQLSEHKTFETLYFPEKRPLLKLVDDFLLKRNKFGIPGFPHKLGLLLDGPPGTGKTSLIKAIAQYTKRHIVTVSLDRINTNQELMDMMFDNRFNVIGADEPMVSKMDEIVFVMEDVDAASSVVYAREGAKTVSIVPPKDEDSEDENNDHDDGNDEVFIVDEERDVKDNMNLAAQSRTAVRTKSAPAFKIQEQRARARSGSVVAAPQISEKTKNTILNEMARWEPEDQRMIELPYKAQVVSFFKQAEVPVGSHIIALTKWCQEQGAVSFVECLENMKPLCKALKDLKPLQSARLRTLASTLLGKKGSDEDDDDDNDDEEGEGDDTEAAALKSAMWQSFMAAEFMANKEGGDASGTDGLELGSDTKTGGSGSGSGGDASGGLPWAMGPLNKSSMFATKDKLNLAGLLNVLDGVVDTPGRILVMTTNHPEKLDPALIRPGRINKRLHLGYCSAETVAEMAKHYLQMDKEMTLEQLKKCAEICELQSVTPAWVEQCCAEVETYTELIRRLKRST